MSAKTNQKSLRKHHRNVSEIMRKVRSIDTAPEVAFRKKLWAKGYRYNLHRKNLPGKPDIVLLAQRLAIFIDGDFWHGGQWRKRKLAALEEQFDKTESKRYWLQKIRSNMSRDAAITAKLIGQGWKVLRIWETEISKDLEGCVSMTIKAMSVKEPVFQFSIIPQRTVAEFFAGIGLMRIGLEHQGWQVKFANDIDEQKCTIYRDHFADADEHLLQGDIHKIDPAVVPSVTLATASFPCNDLSLAGARKGLAGSQSSAFWGFVDILEKMKNRRPPIVLIENVTGFLTSHGGSDFLKALTNLNDLGYSVDAFILDAARFVPQSRQRLFVVGSLDKPMLVDSVKEQFQFFQSDARPRGLADFILSHDKIRWNIRPLPSQPQLSLSLPDILEDLPAASTYWWDKDRAEYLLNQMSSRHRDIADKMINGRRISYGTVFRRVRNGKSMAELRTDGIAGCLRTPRGGSGRQILFKAGKGFYAVRLLTPRECARLMGADDYTINVPLNQALFGFGDAVCVPVIEWIAVNYLNPLVNELMRGKLLQPIEEGYHYGLKRKIA
jgi:DNA (cytosine-5)-methyltransferase 1